MLRRIRVEVAEWPSSSMECMVEKQFPRECTYHSAAAVLTLVTFSSDTNGLGTGQMQNFQFTFLQIVSIAIEAQ